MNEAANAADAMRGLSHERLGGFLPQHPRPPQLENCRLRTSDAFECHFSKIPILLPAKDDSVKRMAPFELMLRPTGPLAGVGTMYSTKPPVTTRLAPVTVGVTGVMVRGTTVTCGCTTKVTGVTAVIMGVTATTRSGGVPRS